MKFTLAAQQPDEQMIEMGKPYKILALSDGARVLRYGYLNIDGAEYYGYWYMELPIANANLSRIDSGACPLLYSHGYQHLGIVEAGAKTGQGLELVVRWTTVPTETPELLTFDQRNALDLWRGVAERTRNAYSVGVEISNLKMIGEQDGKPVMQAESWTLQEVSLVDVGADGSAVRLSAVEAQLEANVEKMIGGERKKFDTERGTFQAQLSAIREQLDMEQKKDGTKCGRCNGVGSLDSVRCTRCNGVGRFTAEQIEKMFAVAESASELSAKNERYTLLAGSLCSLGSKDDPEAALESLRALKAEYSEILALVKPGEGVTLLAGVTVLYGKAEKEKADRLSAEFDALYEEWQGLGVGALSQPMREYCASIERDKGGRNEQALERVRALYEVKKLEFTGAGEKKIGKDSKESNPGKSSMSDLMACQSLQELLAKHGQTGYLQLKAEAPDLADELVRKARTQGKE